MKKLISLLLCAAALTSMCSALAVDAGLKRTVIGADLTLEQVTAVYSAFGISRGDVKELSVTNAEERKYLEGYVSGDVIGTRSISCVYIETLGDGAGLDVSTSNITWCTREMYVAALTTAGVKDAKLIVAAPFAVSGTAALAGVYKAYEDISGEKLDDKAKTASTQELAVTAALADQIGAYGSLEIVNELKGALDETKAMTDEQLGVRIREIAERVGVSLTDEQTQKLTGLCRSLEQLDVEELREKVESIKDTIAKLGEAGEKVSGFMVKVREFFASISAFFAGLSEKLGI